MAVSVKTITITPNTVNVGEQFTIKVKAEDVNWGTIKKEFQSWSEIKTTLANWKAVLNYH